MTGQHSLLNWIQLPHPNFEWHQQLLRQSIVPVRMTEHLLFQIVEPDCVTSHQHGGGSEPRPGPCGLDLELGETLDDDLRGASPENVEAGVAGEILEGHHRVGPHRVEQLLFGEHHTRPPGEHDEQLHHLRPEMVCRVAVRDSPCRRIDDPHTDTKDTIAGCARLFFGWHCNAILVWKWRKLASPQDQGGWGELKTQN
jgi:hypothetical protein